MDESEDLKTLATNELTPLSWPTRRPQDKASYLEEFATHIMIKFNEPTPQKYASELQEFSRLRNRSLACLADKSVRDQQSLKELKKYYCQLAMMLVRFKDCGATFSWKDSLGPGINEGDLEFEINNVMFCIGSIHSELGSKIPKTNENYAKESISHYTSALWWFRELRDNRTGLKPKELGHDLLTFYFYVLRAQAQENVLMHSLKSAMSPKLVCKISSQIAADYETAANLAQTPLYTDPLKDIILGTSVFQSWKSTVSFKHRYFSALTYFLVGISFKDDAKEIGSRIGYHKHASTFLSGCKTLLPDILDNQSAKIPFDKLNNLVMKKLDKSISYNDNVYHTKVLSADQIVKVEPKSLVEAAPFKISSIPEFKDLFSGLVSIESVQVNSIYSQKKDELARDIKIQVENRDEELAHMMSTLNIDKRNLKLPVLEIPDGLMEICAELSMDPQILDEVMKKLQDLDDKLNQMQNMLDSSEKMLKQRPNPKYEMELARYRDAHQKTIKTVDSLHKQLNPDLQREIQKMISTSNPAELLPQLDDQSVQSNEVIKRLEKLLDKVEEMKSQRVQLLNDLKQSLDHDDVIKHVVAAASEHELKNVFDSEIKKHDKYINQLNDNLKLQNDMLDTLERVNAEYGQIKLDIRKKRATYLERVDSLRKYYVQFKEVVAGINSGLEYHNKMIEIVKRFTNNIGADYQLHDLLN